MYICVPTSEILNGESSHFPSLLPFKDSAIASGSLGDIDNSIKGYNEQEQNNLYNNNQFLINNMQNQMSYMSINEKLEVQRILNDLLKKNKAPEQKIKNNSNPFQLESYSTNSNYYIGTDNEKKKRIAYYIPNTMAFNNVIYRYMSDELSTNPPTAFVIKIVININNYIFITTKNDYTNQDMSMIYSMNNDTLIDPDGVILKATSQHNVIPYVFNENSQGSKKQIYGNASAKDILNIDNISKKLELTNIYDITAYPLNGFNIQDSTNGYFLTYDMTTKKYIESLNYNYAGVFRVIKDNLNLDNYSVTIQNIISNNFIKYDSNLNIISEDVFKPHDENYGWILKIVNKDDYIIYSGINNQYLSSNGKNVLLSDIPTIWKLKNIINR
jgi:hypothetical protein